MKGIFNHLLSIFLAVILVFYSVTVGTTKFLASAVEAYETEYSEAGFSYVIDEDGNAIITGGKVNDGLLMIPSHLGGHYVTKIGDSAFLDAQT